MLPTAHTIARRALPVAVAALTLVSARADAHQSSLAYSSIDIAPSRTEIHYTLRLSAGDLFEALGLDQDRWATADEIRSGAAKLFAYVLPRISLATTPALACPAEPGQVVPMQIGGQRWASVSWTWRCPLPIDALAIDYDLFFSLDALHSSPLTATFQDQRASVLLDRSHRRFAWTLAEAPPSGFGGFLRSGVEHILFGLDHVLFLIGLLLAAVLARTGADLEVRSVASSTRYTVVVVSSFTVAHSLTLVAAALGWLPVPARVVESAIALSIVYVAIDNLMRPAPSHRALVGFGFGLLHGMGFASSVRDLLPSDDLVAAVLAFNLGVELGQLGVVAAVLPGLVWIAHRLGPDGYRRRLMSVASVGLAGAGALWLLQRATGMSMLPF